MAATPKYLLDALDLVTRRQAPSPEALGGGGHGRAAALHVRRLRDIFEDKNIVAVGISEKITEGKDTGALSVCLCGEEDVERSTTRRKADSARHRVK
jgi:hypothetical protein